MKEQSRIRYLSFDKTKRIKYLNVLLQNIAGETEVKEEIITKIMDKLNEK
ncbi:MAG: hypothetical protein GXO79_10975 [Chlorobi bacterium]|nr:hypothetical protein [Chlorobiota bacterium]